MSKEAYYFSHDANARHDPKILAMRSEFGIEGYGVYWIIVEMLREQDEYKLKKKDYIYNAIAMQVQCKDYAKEDAKRFVEFCINEVELFDHDEHYFWSNSLLKRMDKRNELSEKRRKAALERWNKTNNGADSEKTDDANAMQVDANAMQTDAIKGKEIKKKGNKNKKDIEPKNRYAEFVTMTQKEHDKLVEKYGEKLTAKFIQTLDNYKGANGKSYKSDYHAILNWVVERVTGNKQPVAVGTGKSKFDGVNLGDE